MWGLNKKKLAGFNEPMALPKNSDEQKSWQDANQSWWESNPMRYDWNEEIQGEEFSKDYYQEIDRRFFLCTKDFLPWKKRPFDQLIDFDALKHMDVLEIGVGSGSHAQLIAPHTKSFTGIDLTASATSRTQKRLNLFNIEANILQMDAEQLQFADNSFDFIWSWGVIHHSANTLKVLQEMKRVLKPNGKACIMVYHRSFWNYYVLGGVFLGIIKGQWFKTRSLQQIVQGSTDGALARYFSVRDWETFASPALTVNKTFILGQKSEMFPMPASKLKNTLIKLTPTRLTRFLTNNCRLGSFLVSELSS